MRFQETVHSRGIHTVIDEVTLEDSRCDDEAINVNSLGTNESIPKSFEDVLEILIQGEIILPTQCVE
jgi:hypothetical protein